jgi:hypothetical protein
MMAYALHGRQMKRACNRAVIMVRVSPKVSNL